MAGQKATALLAMPWSTTGAGHCRAKTCPIPSRLLSRAASLGRASHGRLTLVRAIADAGLARFTTAIKGRTLSGRPRLTIRGSRACLAAVSATSRVRGCRGAGWCHRVTAVRLYRSLTGRRAKSSGASSCRAAALATATARGRRGLAHRPIRAGRLVLAIAARRSIASGRRQRLAQLGRRGLGRTASRRCGRSSANGRRRMALPGRVWCQTGETMAAIPCAASRGTKVGSGGSRGLMTAGVASADGGSRPTSCQATENGHLPLRSAITCPTACLACRGRISRSIVSRRIKRRTLAICRSAAIGIAATSRATWGADGMCPTAGAAAMAVRSASREILCFCLCGLAAAAVWCAAAIISHFHLSNT